MAASSTLAQDRDYLTDAEIEQVRDAQQIDHRINVLIKAMDRRFAALKLDVGAPPEKKKKDDLDQGPEPTGTRVELLTDIKSIMQKAIDDIDNLSERPESMILDEDNSKKPKGFKDIFPAAVRSLAAAATRYKPVIASQASSSNGRVEVGVLTTINELCDEVIASVAKLPAETKH